MDRDGQVVESRAMGKHKTRGRLAALEPGRTPDRAAYEARLLELQRTLSLIQQAYLHSGANAVVVFEGWDAAGKGGVIRRMTAVLDPRGCRVWPIGAPSGPDCNRHYLARFWDKLPSKGGIAIFDRSWYGRVLVERVEGLAPEARWRAAYAEINEFERLLREDGTRLVKIFLHISAEEQLRRFEARLREPAKRWKLSYEDFRNRARWADYVAAAEEMFARTERHVPWTVVASEDKKAGRIAALEHVVTRLSEGVDLNPPPLDPAVIAATTEHLDLPPGLVESLGGRRE
jgi:polyphosphate kinase 2 (PPK2 family)